MLVIPNSSFPKGPLSANYMIHTLRSKNEKPHFGFENFALSFCEERLSASLVISSQSKIGQLLWGSKAKTDFSDIFLGYPAI
jgi:hypothetical protein